MSTSYEGPERRHVATPDYTGRDRRKAPGDIAFEEAVADAAAQAAQAVSRVHRVRLVTQAAIVTFAVSFIVNSALGFVYKNQARQDAVGFSRSNCQLVTGLSNSMADFVATDVSLRAAESKLSNDPRVRAADNKVYGKTLVGKLLNEVDFDEAWAVHRWRHLDEARLHHLSDINCARRVK